ncbi:transporter [Knoellia sinensis KCTC 19936]|uniref:Transporter n=1 Tax=Knoellia sinensis KCTC 19936 TaxID=1385520 RepID=A0A0A0IZJ6_9MICO|nr:MFS transporter [Knoellia sinensis]KGN30228.1 transporter [Knoellia sinensis KCTC 19936]
MTAAEAPEVTTPRDPVQRRTVATLSMSQILGGISLASGVAVGALLAEEVSGSPTYAGLGSTFQVIGSALIAVPMARLSAARGRRPGLALGYVLSFIGALGLIASGIVGSFALLLVASLLFGGSTASNNQARYAAADLADPSHRGRDLSLVVWATTIGSVLGPNLVGPSEPVSDLLGIPRLTGPFVFSLIGLSLAIVVLLVRLRPDPLLESRRRAVAAGDGGAHVIHGSVRRGLRVIAARPVALLGVITLALGHVTMVSVMVMTPLHMRHGHADLTVIGFVISMHILGMFAFSPLTGMAVDRLGGRVVAMIGSGILVTATLLASTAPMGHSNRLLIALFLLGLGWSCTLVSGSTLLTGAVPPAERPGAQGASDLVMGLAAGLGGALAGVIVDFASFNVLALGALVVAGSIGASAVLLRERDKVPA